MSQRAAWGVERPISRPSSPAETRPEAPRGAVAHRLAELVPGLIDGLLTEGSPRIYRAATRLFERPLFSHVLALTRGNQLKAARLLGLNRNTLRKRCRELDLPLPRGSQSAPVRAAARPQ